MSHILRAHLFRHFFIVIMSSGTRLVPIHNALILWNGRQRGHICRGLLSRLRLHKLLLSGRGIVGVAILRLVRLLMRHIHKVFGRITHRIATATIPNDIASAIDICGLLL